METTINKKIQPKQRNHALAIYVGVVTLVTLFYSLSVSVL